MQKCTTPRVRSVGVPRAEFSLKPLPYELVSMVL